MAKRTEEVRNPIISRDAMKEFGFGRKWLLARIDSGAIRSKKTGRYVILDLDDVEREVTKMGLDPATKKLLKRALNRRGK